MPYAPRSSSKSSPKGDVSLGQRTGLNFTGRSLALIGGGWGVVCALALGSLRFVLPAPPERQAQIVGSIALLAAYLLPFVLALLALRWRRVAHQAMAWSAAALAALLASFSAFSGVSLIFLPAALLLGLAALRAVWEAGPRQMPVALLLGVMLAAINTGAFLTLFWHEDGRCWASIREADGSQRWQEFPYGQTMTLTTAGESSLCESNIITPLEGGLSLGILTLTGIGLAVLLPRWPTPGASYPPHSPEND